VRDWLIMYTRIDDPLKRPLYGKIKGATIVSALQNFCEKNVDIDVYSAMEVTGLGEGMGLPIGPDPTKDNNAHPL
jgi:hypothetical protein